METLLQEDATARPMGATFSGPPPKRQRIEEPVPAGPFARAFQGARSRKCVLAATALSDQQHFSPEVACLLIFREVACLLILSPAIAMSAGNSTPYYRG